MHAWLLLFSIVVTRFVNVGQPHINAHAHNDYEHDRPLFEALENGFVSIEADVHLVNGKILVAHDHPTSRSKTLEDLYLRPLDSIARINGGKIYPQKDITVMLMIDIKTDGTETFRALHQLLSKHTGAANHKVFRVFISGNRAIELIRNDPQRLSSIDGRPEDIGKGFTEEEMPVISENYRKIISWNGKGSPAKEDFNKLTELASKVHAENKKLRLWGIPDHENAWNVLLQAGVDLINTDRLKELNLFLTTKKL
ncbi:MAG TPA: phosphatidylinositol-specific phospholipase C/glycerophosphodiester phosphodiesterase family protein [Chryseolinea sp.]|nr:phosphatidylinositol-specific phospholipase C/glycerophosphodiester phosphodiesterase family protein [Chryseolinea sp.]